MSRQNPWKKLVGRSSEGLQALEGGFVVDPLFLPLALLEELGCELLLMEPMVVVLELALGEEGRLQGA